MQEIGTDVAEKTLTGFKDPNAFCMYIETKKNEMEFDTYMETITWYIENESDVEMEDLVKHLNKKLKDSIRYEAIQLNMMKEKDTLVSLF